MRIYRGDFGVPADGKSKRAADVGTGTKDGRTKGSFRSWPVRFSVTRVAGLEAGVEESVERHSQGTAGVRTVCPIGVAFGSAAMGAGLGGVRTGSQQQTVQPLLIMRQARLPLEVARSGLDALHSPTNAKAATIAITAVVPSRCL
jgi:hypothetical protein